MDKQLACATFATLIPVLLIAGHFSGDWQRVLAIPGARAYWGVVLIIETGLEACVIVGVQDPSRVMVDAGLAGSMVALGGVFAMLAADILVPRPDDHDDLGRAHEDE